MKDVTGEIAILEGKGKSYRATVKQRGVVVSYMDTNTREAAERFLDDIMRALRMVSQN